MQKYLLLLLLLGGAAASAVAQPAPARPTTFPTRPRLPIGQYSPVISGLPPVPAAAALGAPPSSQLAAVGVLARPALAAAQATNDSVAAVPPAPRHDLTGPRAFPVYDSYQNLPE